MDPPDISSISPIPPPDAMSIAALGRIDLAEIMFRRRWTLGLVAFSLSIQRYCSGLAKENTGRVL